MWAKNDVVFLLAIGVAAICGAVTGRVFAVEGENRRTSILAAAYCGAGAGLLSAMLSASLLVLIVTALNPATGFVSDFVGAGRLIGPAMLWGAVAGAAGGLAIGIMVALFRRYASH